MLERANDIYIQNKRHLKKSDSSQIEYTFGSVVLPILRGGGSEIDKRQGDIAIMIREAMKRVESVSGETRPATPAPH